MPAPGEVEQEFGVPIPGRILPEPEWARTALKRLPPPGPPARQLRRPDVAAAVPGNAGSARSGAAVPALSRDTAVPVERVGDGAVELLRLLAAHEKQIRKLSDKTGAFPASRNSVTSSTSTIPIRCRSSTSILLPSFRRSWRSVPSPDNSSFKRSASADGSITGLIG